MCVNIIYIVHKQNRENTMSYEAPVWLKPGIIGAIVGAVAVAIVGFGTSYIVTTSSAQEMAEDAGDKAVLAALTPICVEQFKQLTAQAQTTQLAGLKDESSWSRGDYVEERGWATMPGMEEPNDDVADACASQLMAIANK